MSHESDSYSWDSSDDWSHILFMFFATLALIGIAYYVVTLEPTNTTPTSQDTPQKVAESYDIPMLSWVLNPGVVGGYAPENDKIQKRFEGLVVADTPFFTSVPGIGIDTGSDAAATAAWNITHENTSAMVGCFSKTGMDELLLRYDNGSGKSRLVDTGVSVEPGKKFPETSYFSANTQTLTNAPQFWTVIPRKANASQLGPVRAYASGVKCSMNLNTKGSVAAVVHNKKWYGTSALNGVGLDFIRIIAAFAASQDDALQEFVLPDNQINPAAVAAVGRRDINNAKLFRILEPYLQKVNIGPGKNAKAGALAAKAERYTLPTTQVKDEAISDIPLQAGAILTYADTTSSVATRREIPDPTKYVEPVVEKVKPGANNIVNANNSQVLSGSDNSAELNKLRQDMQVLQQELKATQEKLAAVKAPVVKVTPPAVEPPRPKPIDINHNISAN